MQIYIQGLFLVSCKKYFPAKKKNVLPVVVFLFVFSSDIVLYATKSFNSVSLSPMELMSDFYSLNLIQKYLTVSLILQFI